MIVIQYWLALGYWLKNKCNRLSVSVTTELRKKTSVEQINEANATYQPREATHDTSTRVYHSITSLYCKKTGKFTCNNIYTTISILFIFQQILCF